MLHKKNAFYLATLFVALVLATSCQEEMQKADLVVTNATIWTGSDVVPSAEAMAIVGDSILAIGTNGEIQKYHGPSTQVEEMQGLFITPGFIDTHVHLISGGRSLLSVDLRDAGTPKEFSKRIADFSKTLDPGTWILEGNWDHTLWGGELPKKEWIDKATQENPVAISRLDGHMLLANTLALQLAGIDRNSPEVEGGEIVRDENGNPTGILKDNAMSILFEKMPAMNFREKGKAFNAAMDYFLSNGVTSVHDVDGLSNALGSYVSAKKLQAEGNLNIRILAAQPLSQWEHLAKLGKEDDQWIKTGALKGMIDGSLGSHTAAFQEPYTDKADDKGFFINSEEDMYQWISGADKANLQLFVHAIGDRAIHSLLNIFERIVEENGKKDRRLRIEHAQHISIEDVERFAELGVIASMQPYHAIDDGRWAEEYIGAERIKTTYGFKSLLDVGATVAFGSDWAVAPAAPIQGIYAAVTRRTLDGKNPGGWVPEQKISVLQALRAYTKNAAYSSFDEDVKGTLEPGKLADFVVLDGNLLEIDPGEIKNLQVLRTYVAGKKVFDHGEK